MCLKIHVNLFLLRFTGPRDPGTPYFYIWRKVFNKYSTPPHPPPPKTTQTINPSSTAIDSYYVLIVESWTETEIMTSHVLQKKNIG